MNNWKTQEMPTRLESHFGDRVVRSFSERPASVYAMLADAVGRNAHGAALVCGDSRLSWDALHARALSVAGGLARRGVQPGDRVALLLDNGNEFVIATLAIAAMGAVLVPLSTREQTPGIAYVLSHCGARVLIHEAALGDRLPSAAEVPMLERRISVGLHAGSEEFAVLLDDESLAQPAHVAEEDIAAILYTSGTTGRPKGAMLTHLGIVHSTMHYESLMALGCADRAGAVVPLSHVTGLVALLMLMVRCAGTLLLMPAFKAADFLKFAERERMTFSLMVPAMYNLCLLQKDLAGHDLSAWRVGAFGGAPMPTATIDALAARLPNLTLMNAYGATETTSPATLMPPGETRSHGNSVGRPVPCAEIVVMDDAAREVARGQSGEIWIRGPMVVKGYWDNPAATADNFTGGFWHSGDIGMMDDDGYVYVLDRKKDMINRGGFKIYSVEVENALCEHPAVVEAAVVGKLCPVLGERVHAFVMVRDPAVSSQALTAFLEQRLSDYKVPENIVVGSDPLPRNQNGKLLKRILRDRILAGAGS
jgi:long-chain acyl-CoA synthetase